MKRSAPYYLPFRPEKNSVIKTASSEISDLKWIRVRTDETVNILRWRHRKFE